MRLVSVAACLLLAACAPSPPQGGPSPDSETVTISVAIPAAGESTQEYELVQDADRLVAELDGLAGYDDSQDCPNDAGPIVDLVVRGGEQPVEVTLELFGCELVAGWGDERTGAEEVHRLLVELLERQRIATPAPDATPAACPVPLWSQLTIYREPLPHWDEVVSLDPTVPGPPYEAVGARLCHYERTGVDSQPTTERVVDAATAESLRGLVVGDLGAGRPYPCPLETARAYVIVFVDAAGGSFEVRISADACRGITTGSPVYAHGTAGPELLAALAVQLR